MERPPPSQHQVEQAHQQLRTAEHTTQPSTQQPFQPASRPVNQTGPDLGMRPPRSFSLPPSNRQGDAANPAMQSIPNHHQVTAFQLQQGHQQQMAQHMMHHLGSHAPQGVHQQSRQQPVDFQRTQCLGPPLSNSHQAGLPLGEASANLSSTMPNAGVPVPYMDVVGNSYHPYGHPVFSMSSLAAALPSTVSQQQLLQHQQWQQQQLQQQMSMGVQQNNGMYSYAPYSVPAKPPMGLIPVGANSSLQNTLAMHPNHLLPMRLLGDLRLYVPHREPFLGEGGSVHMYLLGKQVKHTVATDEAEECTHDILALIESRQVPSESTMPLLIHDRQVVCGGPEVCLRYLAKKLGHYGSDHLKDALLDRLLTDLNTWFNVQQAAIQAILSPQTMSKDAISDYVKSRFHFYDEAEKLLAFFNQMHTTNSGPSYAKTIDASLRQPHGFPKHENNQQQQQPYFLGDEDSIADYFLFALIDDDQRIAECLISNSSLLGNSNTDSQRHPQENEAKNSESGTMIPMHFFDVTPHLHALYLALLNLPLIQEALLSTEGQCQQSASSETANLTRGTVCPREAEQKQADERQAPNIATEASTAASVNESPMQLYQHVHMPPASNAKRPEQCVYGVDPNMGYFMRPQAYAMPATPAGSLHTTLPTPFCGYNGQLQHMVAFQPVINQSPYAAQYNRMFPQPQQSAYSWHSVMAPAQPGQQDGAGKSMPSATLKQGLLQSEPITNTSAQ